MITNHYIFNHAIIYMHVFMYVRTSLSEWNGSIIANIFWPYLYSTHDLEMFHLYNCTHLTYFQLKTTFIFFSYTCKSKNGKLNGKIMYLEFIVILHYKEQNYYISRHHHCKLKNITLHAILNLMCLLTYTN